ncbi:MAG: MDR family oxidoreductase [Rhizobiaceae bacterium]
MRAVVVRNENGAFSSGIEDIPPAEDAGTTIGVAYSSLNYKDALALTNRSPIVRAWPMVAGIDGAGSVIDSGGGTLRAGASAVVTGWGLGERKWGCFAERVSVEPDWPTPLPAGLTPRESMAFGTAGLTAMLCVMAIERHGVRPSDGPVLVTGAAGGVGGMALMLLNKLGYETAASTGRTVEADYLSDLGAATVIDRAELSSPGKPLMKERWSAVVDSLGSVTLANACASTRYGGVVAACGLAQGMDFPSSVAPFILRGVTLAGIDSVMARPSLRAAAWSRIAELIDREAIERMVREIEMAELFDAAQELLAGKVRGRLVVRIGSS